MFLHTKLICKTSWWSSRKYLEIQLIKILLFYQMLSLNFYVVLCGNDLNVIHEEMTGKWIWHYLDQAPGCLKPVISLLFNPLPNTSPGSYSPLLDTSSWFLCFSSHPSNLFSTKKHKWRDINCITSLPFIHLISPNHNSSVASNHLKNKNLNFSLWLLHPSFIWALFLFPWVSFTQFLEHMLFFTSRQWSCCLLSLQSSIPPLLSFCLEHSFSPFST